jgi:hypothetical protein
METHHVEFDVQIEGDGHAIYNLEISDIFNWFWKLIKKWLDI